LSKDKYIFISGRTKEFCLGKSEKEAGNNKDIF
jgi:hypothetical protein